MKKSTIILIVIIVLLLALYPTAHARGNQPADVNERPCFRLDHAGTLPDPGRSVTMLPRTNVPHGHDIPFLLLENAIDTSRTEAGCKAVDSVSYYAAETSKRNSTSLPDNLDLAVTHHPSHTDSSRNR